MTQDSDAGMRTMPCGLVSNTSQQSKVGLRKGNKSFYSWGYEIYKIHIVIIVKTHMLLLLLLGSQGAGSQLSYGEGGIHPGHAASSLSLLLLLWFLLWS